MVHEWHEGRDQLDYVKGKMYFGNDHEDPSEILPWEDRARAPRIPGTERGNAIWMEEKKIWKKLDEERDMGIWDEPLDTIRADELIINDIINAAVNDLDSGLFTKGTPTKLRCLELRIVAELFLGVFVKMYRQKRV